MIFVFWLCLWWRIYRWADCQSGRHWTRIALEINPMKEKWLLSKAKHAPLMKVYYEFWFHNSSFIFTFRRVWTMDMRDILPFLHYKTFKAMQTKYFLKAYDTHYPLTHQAIIYHPSWPIRPTQPDLLSTIVLFFGPIMRIFKISNRLPPIKISTQTKTNFFLSFVTTLTKEKTLAHLEIPIFNFFNPT